MVLDGASDRNIEKGEAYGFGRVYRMDRTGCIEAINTGFFGKHIVFTSRAQVFDGHLVEETIHISSKVWGA